MLRHQIVKSLMASHTEHVADAAIDLWMQMATPLISVIGEDGFNSLYSRSVYLTQMTFPWIPPCALLTPMDQRFAELKMSLAGQTPALAHEANSQLLITFTDILASLIGEELTIGILRLAWDDNVSSNAGKKFSNG